MRKRLDVVMVERGLVDSRNEAVRLIEAGSVTVSGAPASKASRLVATDEPVLVLTERRWVGRGAEKMEHALDTFGVVVEGRSVVDAGSSTGGFTQSLLSRGARHVVAVDVGTNQLHEKIRNDPRVTVMEQTDVRDVRASDLPFPCSLLVADLSFISLVTVMQVLKEIPRPETGHGTLEMVLLVKPQFEVGRSDAARAKGVIKDPDLRSDALAKVVSCAEAVGAAVRGTCESPILGAEGNVEYLMHLVLPPRP